VKADESKTLKKKAFFQSWKVKVDELIGLFVNQACFLLFLGSDKSPSLYWLPIGYNYAEDCKQAPCVKTALLFLFFFFFFFFNFMVYYYINLYSFPWTRLHPFNIFKKNSLESMRRFKPKKLGKKKYTSYTFNTNKRIYPRLLIQIIFLCFFIVL
jgi:hypothetical protein